MSNFKADYTRFVLYEFSPWHVSTYTLLLRALPREHFLKHSALKSSNTSQLQPELSVRVNTTKSLAEALQSRTRVKAHQKALTIQQPDGILRKTKQIPGDCAKPGLSPPSCTCPFTSLPLSNNSFLLPEGFHTVDHT